MDRQTTTRQTDTLLAPFLHSANEAESEALLSLLISEHAEPIIKGIIRGKLHFFSAVVDHFQRQDAEDVHSDVIVQLLTRLCALKADPDEQHIGDFRGYVAVTSYNACHQHLRQRYPQRWRLKNRLRYLLTHQESFALWETDERVLVCWFSAFRDQKHSFAAGAGQLRQLRDSPQLLEQKGLAVRGIEREGLGDLLTRIFEWIDAPVELDDLVNTVADLQGIKDRDVSGRADDAMRPDASEERLPDTRASIVSEVEQRLYLQHLWSEILQLPVRQRTALLLNLRNEQEGVIALLPLVGIATIRQIAETVAITAQRFAELWNELPLDDATIAELLGATRQQVINLRKSARARLARRMKSFEEGR